MAEIWAAVSGFTTPTAVFLLLNCLVALTFIFASRTDRLPPPTELLSRASSFSFSKLIHNSHTSAAPPEENERASVGDAAAPPETKRISRAPYLLSRIASFKGLSLRRSAAEESDLLDPVDAQPILLDKSTLLVNRRRRAQESDPLDPVDDQSIPLVNRRSEESDAPDPVDAPAGGRIARAETEPRMRIEEAAEETRMRRSLSEKEERETASSEEEVDTMADDFINRFRQQLRLQRLDSLLRFRRSAETGE